MKLIYDFFNRNSVEVAKELLGKKFVFGSFCGIITETEAYRGYDDEASHAFRGITKRSEIMFGHPGKTYVYMIYGIYHCLNIVTEEPGQAGAVLLRGLQLSNIHLNGPGKLCKHLGVTLKHNAIDLTNSTNIYLTEGIKITSPIITTRIGINKAIDKPWRFLCSIV